jgi:hypothetical protein
MSLDLKCDRCAKPINTPGALVFSPPFNDITQEVMMVKKFHVCTACWSALELFLAKGAA